MDPIQNQKFYRSALQYHSGTTVHFHNNLNSNSGTTTLPQHFTVYHTYMECGCVTTLYTSVSPHYNGTIYWKAEEVSW